MTKDKRKTNALAAFAVALLLGGCALSGRQPHEGPSSPSEPAIPPAGPGHPLGTYLTIEGTRAERGKVGVNTLLVDKVDGQGVFPAIGVWIENVDGLPAGKRCVLNGYESGKMIGLPHGVAEKENVPHSRACWQFCRYFIVTSVVEPKDLKLK
jgi:hypothetical protein